MTQTTRGLTLRSPGGATYRFDPGALCLELLPTGGPGGLARFEVLHTPADLVEWAGRSRLTPRPELEVTPLEVAAARLLRDALLSAAVDTAAGRPVRREDASVINEAAAEPPLVPVLGAGAEPSYAPGTGRALLSSVARDAIGLLTGPLAERIRECEAGDCRLVFVDTSRPGRRRWCSMENCGNRHKVRALRARRVPGADEWHEGKHGERHDERQEDTMTGAPVGQTKDAGWEIGVSRTFRHPPGAVWDYISGSEGLAVWLGLPEGRTLPREPGEPYESADGTRGEIRSYRPHDRIRLTWRPPGWDHDSTVQVAVSAKGERAVLTFHQEHLAGPEEREEQRAHWRAAMDSVSAALEG